MYMYISYKTILESLLCPPKVGQIQESIDLLNRKLNEAEMSHQVRKRLSQFKKENVK